MVMTTKFVGLMMSVALAFPLAGASAFNRGSISEPSPTFLLVCGATLLLAVRRLQMQKR